MDYLARLMQWFAVLVLCLVAQAVRAEWYPYPTAGSNWAKSGAGTASEWFDSAQSVCLAQGVHELTYTFSHVGDIEPSQSQYYPADQGTHSSKNGQRGWQAVGCWFTRNSNGQLSRQAYAYQHYIWCIYGYDAAGKKCMSTPPPTCEHGDPQVIGGAWECPEPPTSCPPLGQDMGLPPDTQHTSPGYRGGMVCYNGCAAYPSMAGRGPNGTWYAWGPWTSAGYSCTGSPDGGGNTDPPPDYTPPPQPCPTGRCAGIVNGQNVCVPCGETRDRERESDSTTTVTNPDGSTTTTQTSTQQQTTCTGATCVTTTTRTTTTTTTGPGGGPGTSETTTETRTEERPREDFCQQNPQNPQCVESRFEGSCESSFVCEGDAVQCAMAREQHRRACELFEVRTALVELGESAADGIAQPEGHPVHEAEEQPFSLSSLIDSSPAFGGSGGCPGDVSVGRGLTIKFSALCDEFGILRTALQGFAYLIAMFIVFRMAK